MRTPQPYCSMTDKKTTGPDLDYVCFLGQGSLIKDHTFITSSHLKITGMVELDVECKGNLVISAAGLVMGHITAENVHVYGKVQGNIKAANNVHLYKGAEVVGKINCDFLKVEEGTSCRIDAETGEHADATNNELMQKVGTRYKEKKAGLEKEFRKTAKQPLSEGYSQPKQPASLNGSTIKLVEDETKHAENGAANTNGHSAAADKTPEKQDHQYYSLSSPLKNGRFSPDHAQAEANGKKTQNSKKPLFF